MMAGRPVHHAIVSLGRIEYPKTVKVSISLDGICYEW